MAHSDKNRGMADSNMAVGLLLSMLLVSLSLNVVLGWKFNARAPHGEMSSVAVGSKLGSLPVVEYKSGAATKISFKGVPRTLLYVMSGTCKFCEKNYANIALLASHISGVRVLGVVTSRDSLNEFAASHTPPFPLYVAAEPLSRMGFRSTPQAVLVNENGVVERNWVGVWNPTYKQEMAAVFPRQEKDPKAGQ